jgi:hypothetical protein
MMMYLAGDLGGEVLWDLLDCAARAGETVCSDVDSAKRAYQCSVQALLPLILPSS